MERKLKVLWWGVLVILIILAVWKLFLPSGSRAYIDKVESSREIIVYVTGAVQNPGLVHLPLDARLNDALQQVTILPTANLEALNPAEKLKDGQKIVVPYLPLPVAESPESGNSTMSAGSIGSAGSAGSSGSSGSSGSAAGSLSTGVSGGGVSGSGTMVTVVDDGKININTASAEELDKLPGIGPALAERIIQYRTENGPFAVPEDLQNVSGIGPKTYEKMAPMVKTWP